MLERPEDDPLFQYHEDVGKNLLWPGEAKKQMSVC